MKDWTDQFCGLWQSQQKDRLLEKAFNELVSCGGRTCCVCSILAKDNSPFTHFDENKLKEAHSKLISTAVAKPLPLEPPPLEHRVKSLKVVVKRELITLPASLHIKGEEVRTASGSGSSGSGSSCGEELISCSTCGICVHKCKCVLCVCACVCVCVCVCVTTVTTQPVTVC